MAKLTFLDFVRSQWRTVAPVVKQDLSPKTVVVTGANIGLGLETAKHLASMNPGRLILACRSKDRGEIALKEIEEATGYKNAELWSLDLSNFQSVIDFADRSEKDGGQLDLLVANAAIATSEYQTTVDGYEENLQINYLSTALLSILLLPRLQQAAAKGTNPRVVIVASEVHFWSNFAEDEVLLSSPNILEKFSDREYCTKKVMSARYHDTKLLDVLFARAYAAHLSPSSNIIVNCVNPGFCISSLRRNFSFPMNLVGNLMDMTLALPTEHGSRQLVWAALGGTGREDELKGAYVSEEDVREPSDFVISENGRVMQDRIWNDTFKILSESSPKVGEILGKRDAQS